MMLLVPILFSIIWNSCLGEVDWCSETFDCKAHGKIVKHLLCEKEKRKCTDAVSVLTEDAKNGLLLQHNNLRSLMAIKPIRTPRGSWPRTANTRLLTWDEILEKMATNWAMNCPHDVQLCAHTDEYGTPVLSNNTIMDEFEVDTDKLFTELKSASKFYKDDPKDLVTKFKSGRWNSFTQIIWAKTYKLGCAEVTYNERNGGTHKYDVLACFYGPGGNVPGEEVYQIGEPCSSCPDDCSDTKLCRFPPTANTTIPKTTNTTTTIPATTLISSNTTTTTMTTIPTMDDHNQSKDTHDTSIIDHSISPFYYHTLGWSKVITKKPLGNLGLKNEPFISVLLLMLLYFFVVGKVPTFK